MRDAGVLILAGGEATRLPGKLALPAGGLPLLARVARNVGAGRETWLSLKSALPRELDALLPFPAVVDRWPRHGPLGGMLSTMAAMRAPWVFALAGDAPGLSADFIDELAAARRPGDEAVVPVHEVAGHAQIEPLAALYHRLTFLREGLRVLRAGGRGPLFVLARLRTRRLAVCDDGRFVNVNTPADYAAL